MLIQFQGEYPHTLDGKNRVVLPADLRKNVTEDELRRAVLTIGRRAQWLNLYTERDWAERVKRLRAKYDEDNEEHEQFIRDMMSSAKPVELDSQYRFVIPQRERSEVGIDRNVVFVGMIDRVEIWPEERYLAYKAGRHGKQEPPRE